ncbi:hypothetical protein TELCIR_10242 [Teladorsagia circumcincta]|uniref:Uncharacterized protein n=1 Tax=Teladorsagia circumcincta TaxID=45464 RepID=A0A2G9UCN2_TELCI|nr:hypothetical protein TELCIR_10242 [Teladorsagia circumcincta]
MLLVMTARQPFSIWIPSITKLTLGTKDELEIMESVVKKVDCDSHVLVVDHCMHDDLNFAQSWAHSFRFELVILNPDPSQREEAKSLSEKCGIARVVEVIENVAWQLKKDNFKKITGKQGLDRLLAIIEAMSESSEDSDLEPDDEDKEAIWQAFSSCGIPPQTPETTSSSSVSKDRECEATVSVDVTIVKNERKPDQWFSGLLENKAKGVSDCDIPESTDFNFFQAIKDTRDANMKLLDPAKRADNAAALLSKIVDLNMEDKDEARDKKNQ